MTSTIQPITGSYSVYSYGSLSDFGNEVISKNCDYIFHDANENVKSCADCNLRKSAFDLLAVLKYYVVNEINSGRLMYGDLPRLLSDVSDEECYFEWIFDHVRIGFNISVNESDTGFFVISDDQYYGLDESKPFGTDGMAVSRLIVGILHFIEDYNGRRLPGEDGSRIEEIGMA